jgi:NDP-sugar pyrophosphorylase family protein
MKALILAAGEGTRLRPLTEKMPKALVPVAGVPMLERVIMQLKQAGCDSLVVNICHLGEQIIEFLQAKEYFGIDIKVSDERGYLLDSGGAIKKAYQLLKGDEPFLIHNVDVLTNVDLRKLYDSQLKHGALATLLTASRETSRYFLVDSHHCVKGWINKKSHESLPKEFRWDTDLAHYELAAFTGIHVMSQQLLDVVHATTADKFSIVPIYATAHRYGEVKTYRLHEAAYWFDIGTPERLAAAEDFLS